MPDSPKRRDFLGLTALWGVVIAMGTALAGVMRLPKPAVQPGPLRVFKLGDPAQFAVGSTTRVETGGFFLFREEQGFHAISSVCTHLGLRGRAHRGRRVRVSLSRIAFLHRWVGGGRTSAGRAAVARNRIVAGRPIAGECRISRAERDPLQGLMP